MGTLANFIPPRLRSNLAPEAAGAWPRIVFGDLHGVPARTSLITVPSGPRTSLLQRYRGNLRINPFSSNPPSSPTGKTGRGSPAPVLEGGGGEGGRRDGAGVAAAEQQGHDRQAADRGAQRPAPPSGPGADPAPLGSRSPAWQVPKNRRGATPQNQPLLLSGS